MKKILLGCALLFSGLMFAQGHETFDNLDTTGNSYGNGSFIGQGGIEWTYGQCRGDIELNGKAITLGRNRAEPMFLESALIPGGIGTLEFSYMQAFSKDVHMEVYVNNDLIYTATSNDELEVVKSSGTITVEVDGDFVLRFVNPGDVGQITLDDIIWTAHDGTVGIEDNLVTDFSYFPNPAENILNIQANQPITNVVAYNLLGQAVLNNNNFSNGQVDISSLTTGAYIFKVTFESGVDKTFKIIKH